MSRLNIPLAAAFIGGLVLLARHHPPVHQAPPPGWTIVTDGHRFGARPPDWVMSDARWAHDRYLPAAVIEHDGHRAFTDKQQAINRAWTVYRFGNDDPDEPPTPSPNTWHECE